MWHNSVQWHSYILNIIIAVETKNDNGGIENLMSSPSIKSEEDGQHRSPGCISSTVGTKRSLKEDDNSNISPSKTVKTEDNDEDTANTSSDG